MVSTLRELEAANLSNARSRQYRIRMRVLDPGLRPGGITDITAPIDELATLAIAPDTVIVCENLESVLALPDYPGTVAIHGSGYELAAHQLGWVARARVLYWGDLDADGFAILNKLRAAGIDAQSVLMDLDTLLTYRSLWVPDQNGVRERSLPHLSAAEQRTLDRIIAEGRCASSKNGYRGRWYFRRSVPQA